MAKVYSGVDAAMVERTRKWLLGRRDGKGGYERNSKALDSFGGAKPEATNAYITWALAASKVPRAEIATEISALASLGRSSGDAYIVALAANALLEVGDATAAAEIVERLVVMQDAATGEVKGATAAPSITGSTDKSLSIETTALAAAAKLSLDPTVPRGQRAYDFLVASCSGGGRYGATQSTILALRAILLADTRRQGERRAGTLEVLLGDRVVHTQALDPAVSAPLVVNVPAPDHSGDAAGATTHDVSVRLRSGFDLPYVATAEWYDVQPASDDGCALQLTTALAPARVREGETTVATVTVRCRDAAALKGADGVAMSVAIVGVPGGLEARADQLRELRAEGRIDAYELRGREVVLYWRGFAAGSTRVVPLSLLAAVPGTYTGPASRAYVYYTDERKHWAAPMQATVIDA
jgi:CO dehydrogenase/acetyl-CoA synthase epsilon subunit